MKRFSESNGHTEAETASISPSSDKTIVICLLQLVQI